MVVTHRPHLPLTFFHEEASIPFLSPSSSSGSSTSGNTIGENKNPAQASHTHNGTYPADYSERYVAWIGAPGVGLCPERLGRIFNPIGSVDCRDDGSGVGGGLEVLPSGVGDSEDEVARTNESQGCVWRRCLIKRRDSSSGGFEVDWEDDHSEVSKAWVGRVLKCWLHLAMSLFPSGHTFFRQTRKIELMLAGAVRSLSWSALCSLTAESYRSHNDLHCKNITLATSTH